MTNRASCLRRPFAAVVCATLLSFVGLHRSAFAANLKSPILYSVSAASTRAIALESVSLRSEPFSLDMEANFSPSDPRTRICLFGTDFQFLQGEGANSVTADAQDGAGNIYPMKVEYVNTVPNFAGVYMVVLRLNDLMPSNLGDVLVRVNLHGMASNRVRVAIGSIGGGPADDPGATGTPAPATPPGAVPPLTAPTYGPNDPNVSVADIRRLLDQATWGPIGDGSDVTHIQQVGLRAWLDEQFSAAVLNPAKGSDFPDLPLVVDDATTQCGTDATCLRDNYSVYPLQKQFFTNALTRNTQLRQRVAWALHQILVVSNRDIPLPWWMTPYLQALDRNAFGSYRTLMNDITLNPAMGQYLDMRVSQATNSNENYAREILQLFSVGVNQLNLDGTPVLDSQGKPLATYTQTNVNEFTRLFTGWNWQAAIQAGMTNYRDPMLPRGVNGSHDTGSKTLFNGTIVPACSSPNGAANAACAQSDLTAGLDNIFNHSNVGPFISKQLIQHLVTSNPSPSYVQRVASVFNNDCNGLYPENPCSNARGNLKAVVRNILLDPEARGDFKTDPTYGKLREPVQYINNILRAFNASSDGVVGNRSPASGGDLPLQLDEPVYQPTTVFSYYMPDYQVPGTTILGPAFQILSTSTTLRRANVANTLIYSGIPISANAPTGTQLNFTSLDALAAADTSGGQLVDQLNVLLLHGTMSTSMRSSILTAVLSVPTSDGNFARKRVQTAVYLVTTSPQYDVQR
jgi:uncharacterized protein (DUF1800 family)